MKRFPFWIYHYIVAVIIIIINICYDLHYIMMSVLTVFYISYIYSDYKQTRFMYGLSGDFSFERNIVVKRLHSIKQFTVYWIFLQSFLIIGAHALSYYLNYYYGVIILTWFLACATFAITNNNQVIKNTFDNHSK